MSKTTQRIALSALQPFWESSLQGARWRSHDRTHRDCPTTGVRQMNSYSSTGFAMLKCHPPHKKWHYTQDIADYLPADEGSEHLGHLVCRCEATSQHENAHGTDFPVRFISTLYVLSSMDKNIKAREDNQAAIQDFNKIFWRKWKNIDESAILW